MIALNLPNLVDFVKGATVSTIPVIDERIKHVGLTYLRSLSSRALSKLEEMLVIQDTKTDKPLAVIIPYAMYLEMIVQRSWAIQAQLTEATAQINAAIQDLFIPSGPVDTERTTEESHGILEG